MSVNKNSTKNTHVRVKYIIGASAATDGIVVVVVVVGVVEVVAAVENKYTVKNNSV